MKTIKKIYLLLRDIRYHLQVLNSTSYSILEELRKLNVRGDENE